MMADNNHHAEQEDINIPGMSGSSPLRSSAARTEKNSSEDDEPTTPKKKCHCDENNHLITSAIMTTSSTTMSGKAPLSSTSAATLKGGTDSIRENLASRKFVTCSNRTMKRRKLSGVLDTWPRCASSRSALEPSTHDVLKGRGEGLYNHEGNRFYRWIIKENAFAYQTATKRNIKSGTISEIYLAIQKRGGRFLVLNEDLNLWYEMSDVEAKRKISQSLRDEKKKRNVAISKTRHAGTTNDEQNNEEVNLNHHEHQHASPASYYLPELKEYVTTLNERRSQERDAYCPKPFPMPAEPAPSICSDAPNTSKPLPSMSNAAGATKILFEQPLSPFLCYNNEGPTSAAVMLLPPPPDGPTTVLRKCGLEEMEGWSQDELLASALQPLLENNTTCYSNTITTRQQDNSKCDVFLSLGMDEERNHNQIAPVLLEQQTEDRSNALVEMQKSPGRHGNPLFSTDALAFESSPPNNNINDRFVTDPPVLPSSQEEQKQDEKDGQSHPLSCFPSFGSSSLFSRQDLDHQHSNLVRGHSLEEGSDDSFVIEGMVWENEEY